MPTESEIISRIRKLARPRDDVAVGVGDDAAVIRTGGANDLIACCDLVVEGIHFRADWAEAALIGRKSLAVTLSDVAAMGGVPKFAMISLAVPPRFSSRFVGELVEGIFDLAHAANVSVIGGDTSSSPDSLFIDTSVIGECPRGRAVTRGGARAGDVIYVTGTLGASGLGLALLEGGFRPGGATAEDTESGARQQALMKHLAPEPRLKLGEAIGRAGLATAMIDISDGLSTDLRHILDESDCGAIIHAAAIPIAESVLTLCAGEPGPDALGFALHGGEEYELLFTARPEDRARVEKLSVAFEVKITEIGEATSDNLLRLERGGALERVRPSGYEHII